MNNENTRQNAMWQEFYYKKICIIQTYYYFLYSVAVLVDPSSFTHSSSLSCFLTLSLSLYLLVLRHEECLHLNTLVWVYACDCDMLTTVLFLFVCCFPFPFHLMLSSPDFTLALIFFLSNSSIWSFFSAVHFYCVFFSRCFARPISFSLSFCASLQKYVPAFFFIVIKMEIEHNDMQSRFIHFISIPMFVFLVAFSVVFASSVLFFGYSISHECMNVYLDVCVCIFSHCFGIPTTTSFPSFIHIDTLYKCSQLFMIMWFKWECMFAYVWLSGEEKEWNGFCHWKIQGL